MACTNTVGPAYTPAILMGMSEPLDATTVTSATVTLARTASVAFDGGTNQIEGQKRLTPGSDCDIVNA